MKKKLIAITLILTVLFCYCPTISAKTTSVTINININGKSVSYKNQSPLYQEKGIWMAPIDPVADAIGYRVVTQNGNIEIYTGHIR